MAIITRRIEIYPEDKDLRDECWTYLRDLKFQVFLCANRMVSSWYGYYLEVREEVERMAESDGYDNSAFYRLSKSGRAAFWREAQKAVSERKGTGGSWQNACYKMSAREFSHIPSAVRATLGQLVDRRMKADKLDILAGRKVLPYYKSNIPVPFMKTAVQVMQQGDCEFCISISGFPCRFCVRLGRDRSDNAAILRRVCEGSYRLLDACAVRIIDKKMFFSMIVDIGDEEKQQYAGDTDLAVGVDLGMKWPAVVALASGRAWAQIGDRESFLGVRVSLRKQRRKLHQALKVAKGGKGRQKKLKGLEKIKQKERNFVHTYNHMIARRVVDFAMKQGAGVIRLEDLKGFGDRDSYDYVLRYWSYHELQTLIEQKADRHGIVVEKIDPAYTSQTCADCGVQGNRIDRDTFVCMNVGCESHAKPVNADLNAARNIAAGGLYLAGKNATIAIRTLT